MTRLPPLSPDVEALLKPLRAVAPLPAAVPEGLIRE